MRGTTKTETPRARCMSEKVALWMGLTCLRLVSLGSHRLRPSTSTHSSGCCSRLGTMRFTVLGTPGRRWLVSPSASLLEQPQVSSRN